MAAVQEETRYREITNERGERVIVAQKDTVVTVELEPGVYGTRVQRQTAVVGIAGNNAVAPAPEYRPAIEAPSREWEDEERGCCERAWHCDSGKWYSPVGKGPAWIPFYIILWLILIALAIAFCILVCLLAILYCFSSNDD